MKKEGDVVQRRRQRLLSLPSIMDPSSLSPVVTRRQPCLSILATSPDKSSVIHISKSENDARHRSGGSINNIYELDDDEFCHRHRTIEVRHYNNWRPLHSSMVKFELPPESHTSVTQPSTPSNNNSLDSDLSPTNNRGVRKNWLRSDLVRRVLFQLACEDETDPDSRGSTIDSILSDEYQRDKSMKELYSVVERLKHDLSNTSSSIVHTEGETEINSGTVTPRELLIGALPRVRSAINSKSTNQAIAASNNSNYNLSDTNSLKIPLNNEPLHPNSSSSSLSSTGTGTKHKSSKFTERDKNLLAPLSF